MFDKRIILSLSLFVLALPLARAGDDSGLWKVDYDKALELAAESGKDLLVDFSGSDWCGWCKKLDQEVFSQDLFKEKAPKDFILVVLDFPNGEELKKKIKNPERNQELFNEFGVTGYPTVILLDSAGIPYAQTGYQQGGPEAYLEHLEELKTASEIVKIRELARKLEAAKTDQARIQALQKALDYHDEVKGEQDKYRSFGINFMRFQEAALQSLAWDPDNSAGVQHRAAEFLLERRVTGPNVLKAFEELDPKNDRGYLEKYLMADLYGRMNDRNWKGAVEFAESFMNDLEFREKDNSAVARYYAGFASARLENKEQARSYYKQALALEPSDKRLVSRIERNLKALDNE